MRRGVLRAPFASRKVGGDVANSFPLLKPPTGTPGAERQEFNLAGFPPKVEKDEEGNELPPDPEAPPPELVRPVLWHLPAARTRSRSHSSCSVLY